MSFRKSTPAQTGSRLKRWGEWGGNWDSYLAYLDENARLSSNIVKNYDGSYDLREGYDPPWVEKDFR